MTWSRLAPWEAAYEAGMLCAATATINAVPVSEWPTTRDDGTVVTLPCLCGFMEPDALFIEGNSQHTDYEIEFPTDQWPGLTVGTPIEIDSAGYTVKTMPALQRTGFYSRCQLTRTTRSYPKQPISMTQV